MMRNVRVMVVGTLLAMLTACAGLSGLKAPEVSVADIGLGKATLLEQRLRLTLRIVNPNDRELALQGMTFEFFVADRSFARGVGNQAVVIPPLGEGEMQLEAIVQTLDMLRQLPKLADEQGRLPYRIKGEAVTRDYGRVPFERKGEMSFPRF